MAGGGGAGGGSGRGRPQGSQGLKKVSTGQSRLNAKCAVCPIVQRADKVKEHQLKSVLFCEDGSPASEAHPKYSSLSAQEKKHTDFFRIHGFIRLKFPSNKVVHQVKVGDITAFFGKKKIINNNPENNNRDGKDVDEVDQDMDTSDAAELEEGEALIQAGIMIPTPPINLTESSENPPSEASQRRTDEAASDLIELGSHTSEMNSEEDYSEEEDIDRIEITAEPASPAGPVLDRTQLVKEVADAVSARFGNSVEIESHGNVSKVIAARVVEKMEAMKSREETLQGEEKLWKDNQDDNFVYCVCCLKYSSHDETPAKLRKFNKGNFGEFKKDGGRSHRDFKRNVLHHSNNPLHIWTKSKFNSEAELKVEVRRKNEKACHMIVLNTAHVLKDPAGSATDFQRLNDKDQLLMGDEYPTKNDGKQHYFELRTVFHEKLRKKVQEMMKNVKFFSATLDKVTVGGVGYTVVCTYYFWHGGLKVFMKEF